jgi:hypothetical protein
VNLDGTGTHDCQTGVGFFDHMLDQLARHSLIDLTMRAKGDCTSTTTTRSKTCGIALGQALAKALGDKRGIRRYGHFRLAMDDAQVACALDLSARPYLVWTCRFPDAKDRQLRHRTGARILPGAVDPWRHHAACRPDPRAEQPPHRRGRLQGRRARPARGGRTRSAPGAMRCPSTKGAL